MFTDSKSISQIPFTELARLAERLGNTPLQPLHLIINGRDRRVHLKLEGANPTGSVKDRTAFALIQQLEDQGCLNAQSIIIESTSGNLGVALALQCKVRGYSFLAVIDPKTTQENINKMEQLGAQIDIVYQPDNYGGYLLSRLVRVQELCAQHPHYIWTDQYSNSANPLIHYTSTGPEIYEQMHRKVDAIFVPASTGGTLAGIGRFFREMSPSTRIIGVDARGSVIFGTPSAPRKLTGIGSSRRSFFIDRHLYDTAIIVTDEEAFTFCRVLYEQTGILVGGSSGATLAACAQYLTNHPDLEHVVCLCPDNGTNYLSSIFHDPWLQQQKLDLSPRHLGSVEALII